MFFSPKNNFMVTIIYTGIWFKMTERLIGIGRFLKYCQKLNIMPNTKQHSPLSYNLGSLHIHCEIVWGHFTRTTMNSSAIHGH